MKRGNNYRDIRGTTRQRMANVNSVKDSFALENALAPNFPFVGDISEKFQESETTNNKVKRQLADCARNGREM